MSIRIASRAGRGKDGPNAEATSDEDREAAPARAIFAGFLVFAAWLQSFFGTAEAALPADRAAPDLSDPLTGPDAAEAAPDDGALPRKGRPAAEAQDMPLPDPVAGRGGQARPISAEDGPEQLPDPGAIAATLAPGGASVAAGADPGGTWGAVPPATAGVGQAPAAIPAPSQQARPPAPTPADDPDAPFVMDETLSDLLASLDSFLGAAEGLNVSQITDLVIGDVLRAAPMSQIEHLLELAGADASGTLGRIGEILNDPASRLAFLGQLGLGPDAASTFEPLSAFDTIAAFDPGLASGMTA